MNVCCTDVMAMPAVQTMTVRLSVGVELDFLEMDLIVQVSNVKWRKRMLNGGKSLRQCCFFFRCR